MARITVDDCLKHIPNRYQLTLVAAVRARMIVAGADMMVESHNKSVVSALREVAQGAVGAEVLKHIQD